jgi:hypothetical protein
MIMSARETAELLLLVGRLVQADGYEGELSPAQWMALRFFARANAFSRTSHGSLLEIPRTPTGLECLDGLRCGRWVFGPAAIPG